jgi:GNAT superfamily N-acetyltransferase
MTVCSVRPARSDDYEQWLELWRGYLTFYESGLPDAVTASTWARFFDPAEPIHALVAECGGELAGLAHYSFHLSSWSIRPYCYLEDLFAAQHVLGRGVGRTLIEAVYEAAARERAARVYWQTHEANHQARELYERIATRTGFLVYRKSLEGDA